MRAVRFTPAVGSAALLGAAFWWRTHPSACPYSQRFWVEAPHPLITRSRLREALEPSSGECLLEVGPGTGYYTLPVAEWLGPEGVLEIVDL
jgi:protein-L-isoaspartate O-methyltransferase